MANGTMIQHFEIKKVSVKRNIFTVDIFGFSFTISKEEIVDKEPIEWIIPGREVEEDLPETTIPNCPVCRAQLTSMSGTYNYHRCDACQEVWHVKTY